MKRFFPATAFLSSLLFWGCASQAPVIRYSSQRDFSQVETDVGFLDLKEKYTVSKEISFGPDPEEARKGLELAKKNIYYEIPERKIVFSATVWDLPLIKAYLETQKYTLRSTVGEELKNRLLKDFQSFTQIMVSVDSHVNHYFSWDEWTLWLEDRYGRTYFPPRTDQSSESETIFAESKNVLGREKTNPRHVVFHEYGTLFFNRMDLQALSPISLIFMDNALKRKVVLKFRVKGQPAIWEAEEIPVVEPPAVEAAPPPPLSEEEKKKKMRAYFMDATALFKSGQYEAAIQEWERVLELDPTHKLSKTKIEKARQELAKRRPDPEPEMAEAEENELELSPAQKKKRMQVHFLLATEYYKDGEFELAIQEWEQVLVLDPNHELSKDKIEKARAQLSKEGYEGDEAVFTQPEE